MLIDHAIIEIEAGKGGDGHCGFRREKYIPKGGPDGGDGGDGGSIYLVASSNVSTLFDMNSRKFWKAQPGESGRGKDQHGANGDDLTIEMPVGTLIFDADTDELLEDLDSENKRWLAAAGGRGGFGNTHFKSATNQTPRQFTPGEPGVRRKLRLELKLIADVGLVGKPNAGKSTLLSRLSRAKPKIADYPFTTLDPQLGIAELSGHRRIIVADIPGLIEGASDGAGLGHEFLRHIERTRILVHVIELEPSDESDPMANYKTISHELNQYSQKLAEKPLIIAINKLDLYATPDDQQTAIDLFIGELGAEVFPISAATGQGCEALMERCWEMLNSV